MDDRLTEALAAAREFRATEPCAANLPLHDRFVAAIEALQSSSTRFQEANTDLLAALEQAHVMLCEWRNSMEEPTPHDFCRVEFAARSAIAKAKGL